MPHIDIRPPIRAIWEEFWHAGIHDTADIMEQMLYLLFLRRLDDVQARAAALHDGRSGPRWSPSRADDQRMRWSSFKDLGEPEMFALFADHVFPRLRCLGGPGAAYAQLMKGARLMIPTAAALARVVRMIEALPRPADAERTCPAYDYLAARLGRLGRRGRYHAAPYRAADGGLPRAGSGEYRLQLGWRRLRFPGRGRRVPDGTPSRPAG